MIIYHDPETLAATHIVTAHDDAYDPACNGAHHVVLPPGVAIPLEHIHLARDADDTIRVSIRRFLPIVMPDKVQALGATVRFGKVPPGTTIAVGGAFAGTMDDACDLDFEPRTTGFYAFVFSRPGWMDARFELEVVGPTPIAAQPAAQQVAAPSEVAA